MPESGKIVQVREVQIGTNLIGEHLTGVTELSVYDGMDFNEDGGNLQIDDEVIAYSSWSEDDGTITLAAPTTADHDEGSRVVALPLEIEYEAVVELADGEAPLDPVGIPQSLVASLLPAGIREPGEGETALVEDTVNGWMVVDVLKQTATVDAATLVGQIPESTPVAPDLSPTPTVIGTLRQLIVQVAGVENATPVEYEYHLSVSDGFTPDTDTLAASTSATGVSLATLPDGTPLAYDTTYYVVVIAKSGDQVASPSEQRQGELNRAGSDDLATGSVTAAQIAAIVTLSTLFRTAETGGRIEFDNQSFRIYDSTGALRVRLAADEVFVDADRMTVRSLETLAATLGGETFIPAGAEVRLGAGTLDSPAQALSHESVPLSRVGLERVIAGVPAITDDTAAQIYRVFVDPADNLQMLCRRNTWDGAFVSDQVIARRTGTVGFGELISSAITDDAVYYLVALPGGGNRRLYSTARPTSNTWGDTSTAVGELPTAPGTGGYADGEPIIGVQRTTGDMLLAHRVQGTQTIGSQSYDDDEVMVRRYSTSVTGTALTLTLNKTIGPMMGGNNAITSVLMDATSGTFDMPTESGKTALVLQSRGGIGPFGLNEAAFNFANSGAFVPTSFALGAFAWYDDGGLGAMWDGSAFWSTDAGGDAIREYGTSAVSTNSARFAYTYWDGTHETKLSPIMSVTVAAPVRARYQSRWTIPTLPAGISQARLYTSAVDSPTTRFERIGTYSGTAAQPLVITANPITPPGGTATNPPPTTSNFSGGNVAAITNYDGTEAFLKSDGSGTLRTPAGVVTEFAGSTAPTGWLMCNGSAVSRTTYADLYAVVGTTYGAGDGSTTFNLPDHRGRVGVGVSTDDEFNTLGETGGEKTHTLTTAELATHSHVSRMTYNLAPTASGSGANRLTGVIFGDSADVDRVGDTDTTGDSAPHNNLQPYIALNYIIKA